MEKNLRLAFISTGAENNTHMKSVQRILEDLCGSPMKDVFTALDIEPTCAIPDDDVLIHTDIFRRQPNPRTKKETGSFAVDITIHTEYYYVDFCKALRAKHNPDLNIGYLVSTDDGVELCADI